MIEEKSHSFAIFIRSTAHLAAFLARRHPMMLPAPV
jgi:hypothetical protein